MERNREAKRGTVAVVNGGMSRRRQRNGSYRDSPDEDGGIEMQEAGRLRDRVSKKDRDRDRSGRSKRRRGERIIRPSNRDDGGDSSEESVDEEEDEEDDASVTVRQPPAHNLEPPSFISQNHHRRKTFPMTTKVVRPPAVTKAPDEMIGVPVPRRARSSSGKRSQEFSGGGGGGGGEPFHQQASTSPPQPSPSPNTLISPSPLNSLRKKTKPISGTKNRQPKIAKSSSVSEDIEIEVAEVLFGLTRQFQSQPKPEFHQLDSRDTNGSSNEVRSRVSSPISTSQPSVLPPNMSSNSAPMVAMAPKRKRPRLVKLEDETPTSPASLVALPTTSVSSAAKMEPEQPVKTDASSPRSEKNTACPAIENSRDQFDLGVSQITTTPTDAQKVLAKSEIGLAPVLNLLTEESGVRDGMETKEEFVSPTKEIPRTGLDVKVDDISPTDGAAAVADNSREVRYSIDLMAPPSGKSSPEREGIPDYATDHKPAMEMAANLSVLRVEITKGEDERVEKRAKQEVVETILEARVPVNYMSEDFDSKKKTVKEKTLDLQLDLLKMDSDGLGGSRKQLVQKQQAEAAGSEPKSERLAQSVSLPLPMPAGWPGGFPHFGYMGQVPTLQAVNSGSSKTKKPPNFLSSQLRPKRCATHCYIAHNIHYHQQIANMPSFWPGASGAMPQFGSKQYNLNAVPPLESSILGTPLQGRFPSLSSMQDKGGPLVSAYTGLSTKENPAAGNAFIEAAQRKQLVLQQAPQPGSATSMLAPAFIFPISEQQATARSGPPKSTTGTGSAAPSASTVVAGSGTGGPATAMTFNYPGLPPNEAQYMAILQNSAYPFPIPGHVGAPPPYGGGTAAQALPFFNGSFYSQMLRSPQLQQQQQLPPPQQPPHSQQGNQNTSTSSGSSTSQKPPQQAQRASGGGAAGAMASSHGIPASKQRQQQLPPPQRETGGGEDNPSTADSKVSHGQKRKFGQNSAGAIHPQGYALISPATAAFGGGGGSQRENLQTPTQHQTYQSMKVELSTSQAFAMPYASFTGAAAASFAPPQGLDFSSMARNHALFQSLPEAMKHGYHINGPAVSIATQNKKPHHQVSEDVKSAGDSMNASVAGEERKILAAGKAHGNEPQQPLTLSRPDSDAPISTTSSTHAKAAPTTSGSATATAAAPISNAKLLQPQQQQLIHLQSQLQRQQQQHHIVNRTNSTPNNSATIYTDRLPVGYDMAKFPQALAGFPQALIQSSAATHSSPQWKTPTRAAAAAAPTTSSAKNQLPHQQGRTQQQQPLTASHQTQISFGVNSPKAAATPTGQQHLGASAQHSVAKSAGGSPRASAGTKPGSSQAALLHSQQQQQQQQQLVKNSSSSSTLRSSPLSNQNVPSILGHPHKNPAPGPSTKQQKNPQQQTQPFHQAQFFFSNAYLPAQLQQSNGSGYYQRRPSEQPPQVAAAAQPASGATHHLMSPAAFPYTPTMPPVPVKPAEQKPAAGNDSLNACWQPEKR